MTHRLRPLWTVLTLVTAAGLAWADPEPLGEYTLEGDVLKTQDGSSPAGLSLTGQLLVERDDLGGLKFRRTLQLLRDGQPLDAWVIWEATGRQTAAGEYRVDYHHPRRAPAPATTSSAHGLSQALDALNGATPGSSPAEPAVVIGSSEHHVRARYVFESGLVAEELERTRGETGTWEHTLSGGLRAEASPAARLAASDVFATFEKAIPLAAGQRLSLTAKRMFSGAPRGAPWELGLQDPTPVATKTEAVETFVDIVDDAGRRIPGADTKSISRLLHGSLVNELERADDWRAATLYTGRWGNDAGQPARLLVCEDRTGARVGLLLVGEALEADPDAYPEAVGVDDVPMWGGEGYDEPEVPMWGGEGLNDAPQIDLPLGQ